jgi:hypothetical protein
VEADLGGVISLAVVDSAGKEVVYWAANKPDATNQYMAGFVGALQASDGSRGTIPDAIEGVNETCMALGLAALPGETVASGASMQLRHPPMGHSSCSGQAPEAGRSVPPSRGPLTAQSGRPSTPASLPTWS